MTVNGKNLRRVVGASAAVTTALQAATAVTAIRRGRRDYADGVWGPGLAAIAVTSAVVGRGDPWRRWVTAAVTVGWASRLETAMLRRLTHADQEDPRYTEFLENASTAQKLSRRYSSPRDYPSCWCPHPCSSRRPARLPRGPRRWLFPAGIAVMFAGAVIEGLADHQKTQFQQREDDAKPDVLDTGLWGWSRHPNYFGDSDRLGRRLDRRLGVRSGNMWTFPAPALMSYLLIFATGSQTHREADGETARLPGLSGHRVAFFFPWRKRTDQG